MRRPRTYAALEADVARRTQPLADFWRHYDSPARVPAPVPITNEGRK